MLKCLVQKRFFAISMPYRLESQLKFAKIYCMSDRQVLVCKKDNIESPDYLRLKEDLNI
jgi:hypothetical protein